MLFIIKSQLDEGSVSSSSATTTYMRPCKRYPPGRAPALKLIPQRAVDRPASPLRRALRRVDRVLNPFAGTVQAVTGALGGTLLVAGGQTCEHDSAGGDHQRFTHKHLSCEQNRRNDRSRNRFHRRDRAIPGVAWR